MIPLTNHFVIVAITTSTRSTVASSSYFLFLCKVTIHVPAGITREVLKIHLTALRGIYAVFTWESRAVHIRYRPQIYGKYGGIGVLFGGGGPSCLQVSCVVRLPFSLFSFSLFAPFPPALCVRLQLQRVHRHGPWLYAYRQVRNVTENFEEIP